MYFAMYMTPAIINNDRTPYKIQTRTSFLFFLVSPVCIVSV
jgi:hypothetical protein